MANDTTDSNDPTPERPAAGSAGREPGAEAAATPAAASSDRTAAPRPLKRLCVFCGSGMGAREEYAAAARGLGELLAARGLGVVYGGGQVGLMGTVADAAMACGGEVIGVIPYGLAAKEIDHRGLSELHVVDSMHERKAMMADLADGFIALPGGMGTFEELFEVLTWAQLGIHTKPCGLLDVAGYYRDLLGFLDHATEEGFIRPAHRGILLTADEPGALIDAMAGYRAPELPQWLDRSQT
ncbi:MAG: TIGR00730 family Rossman fold protein [Haliangiales bacterium]